MIESERLLLRMPTLDDVDALLELTGDPEVMRWIGGEAVGRSETLATVERWLERWDANRVGPFMVERDGELLGRTGFLVWDAATWHVSTYAEAAEPELELGWAFARRHWGKGYATEAARAARDWASPERLISVIEPENARSIRVAEKLGAQPTDTVTLNGETPAVVWVHPR